MSELRIISFLPAATEMVYALGLGDNLVGVSHECDYPPQAKTKPVVVRPAMPIETMSLREIDAAVAERIGSGQSLYQVDEKLLRELKPNLILTQNLCQVCGPAGNEVTVVLKTLTPKPEIVWMTPHSLEEIFQDIRELGDATGRVPEATRLIQSLRERLRNVQEKTASIQNKAYAESLVSLSPPKRGEGQGEGRDQHHLTLTLSPTSWRRGSMIPPPSDRSAFDVRRSMFDVRSGRRPRVFCLEWIDPYYCCGHWVPEMIELAGGQDALGRKGTDSVRIPWSDIAAWAPEILIISPCGFDTAKAVLQAKQLLQQPGWSDLPAVRNNRVFAVNANAYFARPGPRVVDGVELLAHLIHPELFPWNGPADAFQQIATDAEHLTVSRSADIPVCGLTEHSCSVSPGEKPATGKSPEPAGWKACATGRAEKQLDRQLAQAGVRKKICDRCGAEFSCGPGTGKNGGCWCNEFPTLLSVDKNADCFCPNCLRAEVEKQKIAEG